MKAARVLLLLSCACTGVVRGQEFEIVILEDLPRYFRLGAVADMNADDLSDLIGPDRGGPRDLNVLVAHDAGGFSQIEPDPGPMPTALSFVVADFNADGFPEIVSGDANAEVAILWNGGDGSFSRETVDPARGTYFLHTVDIDRDGRLDLLSVNRGTGEVVWYTVRPEGCTAHVVETVFNEPFSAAAGNLDDDEAFELVVSSADGYYLLDWEDSEDPPGGSFVEPVLLMNEAAVGRHVVIADVDHDGGSDIAMAIRSQGEDAETKVVWLRNEGGLTFSTRELAGDTDDGYFRWIEAADLDGDRDLDLIVSRWSADVDPILVFLNDGIGGFTRINLNFPSFGFQWRTNISTFFTWPTQDGGRLIVPSNSPWDYSWPLIRMVPQELPATVRNRDGEIEVSWRSVAGWVYRLQFSRNLREWSERYLSGGVPVVVDGLAGTGVEMTFTLAPPDAENLHVRVIGVTAPPE